MPKRKAAPVDQLRLLNELLGRVSDPQKAEHARRALEFAYTEHPRDARTLAFGRLMPERGSVPSLAAKPSAMCLLETQLL